MLDRNAYLIKISDLEKENHLQMVNEQSKTLRSREEIAKLQAEYDAKEYARKRVTEYPSIPDQLDTLYHSGLDAWKAEIKTVKDKYPKP